MKSFVIKTKNKDLLFTCVPNKEESTVDLYIHYTTLANHRSSIKGQGRPEPSFHIIYFKYGLPLTIEAIQNDLETWMLAHPLYEWEGSERKLFFKRLRFDLKI